MRELIVIRMIPKLGYVCHGLLWYSLDNVVLSMREKFPGCTFRIIDADAQTKIQWERDHENGIARIAA